MDIVFGIAGEEVLFIEEGESQALEALIKPLHKLMPDFSFGFVLAVLVPPVEDVPRVVDLMIIHVLFIAPDSSFYEVHLQLLMLFELNGKPGVFPVNFVQKFKE